MLHLQLALLLSSSFSSSCLVSLLHQHTHTWCVLFSQLTSNLCLQTDLREIKGDLPCMNVNVTSFTERSGVKPAFGVYYCCSPLPVVDCHCSILTSSRSLCTCVEMSVGRANRHHSHHRVMMNAGIH